MLQPYLNAVDGGVSGDFFQLWLCEKVSAVASCAWVRYANGVKKTLVLFYFLGLKC